MPRSIPWLALACAAALAAGCAVDGGYRAPADSRPRPRPAPPVADEPDPHDRALDRAYDDGYSRGWGDREQGRSPDVERWADERDAGDPRSFRSGYADGYQRRPHRYGGAAPDVAPAAPDWLVGEFAGWDEREDVEVVLQVRRDGGVTLVGGGRRQDGVYRNGRLELRRGVWRVQRLRGGIVIAPETAPGEGVRLTRR
jgi:hypothetical protein